MVRRLFVQAQRAEMTNPQLFNLFSQFVAEYREEVLLMALAGKIPEEMMAQLAPIELGEVEKVEIDEEP